MSDTPKKTKTPKAPKVAIAETSAPAATEPGKRDIGTIAKANAEKRKTLAQSDVFVFVKTPEKPVAPQANVIVDVIKAAGEAGIKRGDLVVGLKGPLKTRQPEERILTYYQASLVDAGIIKIVNPERDAAATAKTAPEPKETAPEPESAETPA